MVRCRTELLFTFVRNKLAVIVLGGSKAKFDREKKPKSRGLFADVGSVTAAFIRVVQRWFRAKRQITGR